MVLSMVLYPRAVSDDDVQVSANLSDILTPHTLGGLFRGWCRPVVVAPLASMTAVEKCAASHCVSWCCAAVSASP